MSLRDVADRMARSDDVSNIGRLRSMLTGSDLAELDDVLWGEPRIGHVYVAKAVNEAYGDLLSRPVTGKQVEEFRKKPRL